jgi:solute carrier family 25 (adenine nucleotide translocator) protein 4/5/6/31
MRGIYRGVLLSYLGMTLFRGAFFGIYDTFKVKLDSHYQKFFVSYGATVISMFLVSPIQTVTRRLMMTSGHSFKYQGYADCAKQIYKSEKIKGFYRGGSIIPFESIMVGMMFTLFDRIFTQLKSI